MLWFGLGAIKTLMDKLTLDTSALRDWLWCEGKSPEKRYDNDATIRETIKTEFSALVEIRDNGICELAVTTQLYTDYDKDPINKDPNRLPKGIEELIGVHVELALPSISAIPFVLPMVLIEESWIEEILNILFPVTIPDHRKYHR